ncbi:hypothetical protein SD457_16990 [Coprobacillaceae bacterium CR2/5/TPMF4]|nr:hypothetical protein SD457_16990 [Coprobacillaceae bacterium CR2/5/TPMF4]
MVRFSIYYQYFFKCGIYFLPVLIGFSATKKFGGNPYLGAAMGMIMVHPDLLNAYDYGKAGVEIPVWNLFGLTVGACRVSRNSITGFRSFLDFSKH